MGVRTDAGEGSELMLILPTNHAGIVSFLRIIGEAAEANSIPGLLEKLKYLHTYADPEGKGEKQQVFILPSARNGDLYFDVLWKRPVHPNTAPLTNNWETWMNGALVCHKNGSGCDWSIHT